MKNICSSTRASPANSASCRSSTAQTTKTLSSPSSPRESAVAATASERISPAKSSPSPKKICSNTAPTVPMPSILSTSAARNSRTGILSHCQQRASYKFSESEKLSACRFAPQRTLLEHRTDGTDAFDTLYIGCEKFPYHDSFTISISGFI